ncbi:hypothetical protein [Pendulispora albinea]|uniref:Uncharacterized protein n=1 Tax=Pendulispora albinea TaxID=2741071 RepID=A0ABZ2M1N4_9BACT
MDIRAPFATHVLRVLFESARDRAPVDADEIIVRVVEQLPPRGDRSDLVPVLRIALRMLERSRLVEFEDHDRIRLTMTGLALAVSLPPVSAPTPVAPPGPSSKPPTRTSGHPAAAA